MEANKIPNSAQSMTREQILEVALNMGEKAARKPPAWKTPSCVFAKPVATTR